MTGPFILDYYLLVLWASFGVFQAAAAWQRFGGMLVVPNRAASMVLGLSLVAGAFAWFFLSEPRNVPDTGGGLNGNQQFAYFFAGSASGLTLTLGLSSLRHLLTGNNGASPLPGLDALRHEGYFQNLYRSASLLRHGIRSQSGEPPPLDSKGRRLGALRQWLRPWG